MQPRLSVSHLSFGFPSQERLLKDVSFTIENHSFIALIGPNGCGKSTLLKLLLGELPLQQGTITFSSNTRIGYVPQSLVFDKHFPITALEVVSGGCHSMKISQKARLEKAQQALENVDLGSIHDMPFGALSGGQAQRVLIARALVQQPTLLLLDEPTANIDTHAQTIILDYLLTKKDSLSIFMVTHNLRTILSCVDGVLCLQQGMTSMRPKEVCEHFALGLYHEPLMDINSTHFME